MRHPPLPLSARFGRSATAVLIVAFVLGLLAGWIDLHANEVQATVFVLLVSAGGLGLLAPRWALPAGLIVGLGVPIAHLYGRLAHVQLPYPMGHYAESFIALIPAMLAAIIGAGVRKALTPGIHER